MTPTAPPLPRWRVERALPQLAELTGGTGRAEEDQLVLVLVGVALDEVRLPAASLGIGAASAFDADELGGRHGTMMPRVAAARKWPDRTVQAGDADPRSP